MNTLPKIALIAALLGAAIAHASAKPPSTPKPAADDFKPPVFAFAPKQVTETQALFIVEPSDPLPTDNFKPGSPTAR